MNTIKLSNDNVVKINIGFVFFILSIVCSYHKQVYAEHSLSTFMQQMNTEVAVKMAYQEQRTLELMDQPWQGTGYMYSLAPNLMIREQLTPKRLIMGIKDDQMYYFDADNDIRHQGELAGDSAISLKFVVFKALINADEALLLDTYRVNLSTTKQGWMMNLKSKTDQESDFNIVVKGLLKQQPDTIKIRQADGDVSNFTLQKVASGDEVVNKINILFRQLAGE